MSTIPNIMRYGVIAVFILATGCATHPVKTTKAVAGQEGRKEMQLHKKSGDV